VSPPGSLSRRPEPSMPQNPRLLALRAVRQATAGKRDWMAKMKDRVALVVGGRSWKEDESAGSMAVGRAL
jgi:hypothetical protein